MKVRIAALGVLAVLLVGAVWPACADYLELEQVLGDLGASLEWDPISQTGSLCIPRAGAAWPDRVSFQVGSPWLILNHRFRLDAGQPVVRDDRGHVLLPEGSLARLKERLSGAAVAGEQPRVAVILIDAGHGGKDAGAVGAHTVGKTPLKVLEKDVVLGVATRLHALLLHEFPDKRILMTRTDDRYVPLEERTQIANSILEGDLGEQEAIIFISIHANAAFNRKAQGYEVWYLPPDYRRELIDPNSVDQDSRDVAPILNVLLEEEYTVESITLARQVLSGLEGALGDGVENRGLREESWFVVRNAKMPSILVEVGFVTNPEEAARLSDGQYLQKLAQGIYTGVRSFVRRFERTRGFTE